MFTGIVEAIGTIDRISREGANRNFFVKSDISKDLRVDQSVCHNGVCLTVTKVQPGGHWTTAVQETLLKSTLGEYKEGDEVNLERSMLNNGRFDGHIVQGHVDQTAVVRSIKEDQGSWIFDFEYNPATGNITVEKGSICVDGVSLTCFKSRDGAFSVAIIPFTYEHTNMRSLRVGQQVNLEFDIIGKYVRKLIPPQR